MEFDLRPKRFVYLVNFFVLSILFLVIRPRLVVIILGWDGLGVISFLLVIYYNNFGSLKSGLVTIYINRFGDVAILFSLFLMYSIGYWPFWILMYDTEIILLSLFLALAASTKRAQLPFSAWLPAAMAAPTPVSSLVHSSTLVTAGVYLIIRFFFIYNNFFIRRIFLYIAFITSFFSGVVACVEPDLKKVVAISTLRQLGLIIFMVCYGEFLLTFFHIVSHAIFKSLLFLSCGILIIISMGGQDRRFIGGFRKMNWTFLLIFSISRISLIGFPFTAGFYSKDLILERSLLTGENFVSYIFLYICCILTVLYRIKIFLRGLSSFRLGELFFLYKSILNYEFAITILSIWAVTAGKALGYIYFSWSFFCIKGMDKTVGIAVLRLGILLSFFKLWKFLSRKFWKEIMGELFFINWIFGGFWSKKMVVISYLLKGEFFWLEFIGIKRFNLLVYYFSSFNFLSSFYLGKFLFFFIFLFYVWF